MGTYELNREGSSPVDAGPVVALLLFILSLLIQVVTWTAASALPLACVWVLHTLGLQTISWVCL